MKSLIIILAVMFTMQVKAQLINIPGTAESVPLPGIINKATVEKIMCGEKLEIKDHMSRMGFIIRSLRELVNDLVQGYNADENKAIIMVDAQVLRTHLAAVFPKTPTKIINIDPNKIQQNKVIFQRYLLKVIGYTIDIEDVLLKQPTTPSEVQAQQVKIANLIITIEETIQEAHKLFRD